jgi:hypothetical protein
MAIIVIIFCNKAIEKGDGSYCCFLFFSNTEKKMIVHCHAIIFFFSEREEGNGNLLPLPSLLQ